MEVNGDHQMFDTSIPQNISPYVQHKIETHKGLEQHYRVSKQLQTVHFWLLSL